MASPARARLDEQQKPCGARFVGAKPDLDPLKAARKLMGVVASTKPAHRMSLKWPRSCQSASSTPTACGFVPNVRQTLYSDVLVALAEPQQAAVGTDDDKASTPLPACRGAGTRSRLATSSSRKRNSANGWWGRRSSLIEGRHADAAVSATTRGCRSSLPSHRGRADESRQRSGLAVSNGSGCDRSPSPLPQLKLARTSCSIPSNPLEVQSWTQRLRAFAR